MARILLTGAAGSIGTFVKSRLPQHELRLLDIQPIPDPHPTTDVVIADFTDFDQLCKAMQGMEAVVHLAGASGEFPWEDVLRLNIDGTYTVLEAARSAGVSRVVLASSNHAVGYFPRDDAPAPADAFPAPDTYYGVSKVAMEALGSLYADRYGLDVVCLRIGSCFDLPKNTRMLSTWLSPDDAARLIDASVTCEQPGFAVVWGISNNTRGWFDLSAGYEIGFHPEDNAEEYAEELIAKFGEPNLDAMDHALLGGPYCSAENDFAVRSCD